MLQCKGTSKSTRQDDDKCEVLSLHYSIQNRFNLGVCWAGSCWQIRQRRTIHMSKQQLNICTCTVHHAHAHTYMQPDTSRLPQGQMRSHAASTSESRHHESHACAHWHQLGAPEAPFRHLIAFKISFCVLLVHEHYTQIFQMVADTVGFFEVCSLPSLITFLD